MSGPWVDPPLTGEALARFWAALGKEMARAADVSVRKVEHAFQHGYCGGPSWCRMPVVLPGHATCEDHDPGDEDWPPAPTPDTETFRLRPMIGLSAGPIRIFGLADVGSMP